MDGNGNFDIVAENICFKFNDKEILHDVSLKINSGKIYGIIGPNGAGKSTLLRIMSKVLKQDKGDVFIGEKNIKDISYNEIAKIIAYVAQNPTFYPFTVFDYVSLGRIPYLKRFQKESKKDKEIVEKSLEFTDTLKFKDKIITELSGGERQRVVSAKALAQEPKILFADEPISQLDINYQIEIMDVFKRLTKERKITTVCVLHDLNIAAMFCEELILMHNGKILKAGNIEEVITPENIKNAYGIDVIVAKNPYTNFINVFPLVKKT